MTTKKQATRKRKTVKVEYSIKWQFYCANEDRKKSGVCLYDECRHVIPRANSLNLKMVRQYFNDFVRAKKLAAKVAPAWTGERSVNFVLTVIETTVAKRTLATA